MIQSAVPGFRFSAGMRFDGVAVGSSFLLQASNTSDIARDSNSLFMMVMVMGFSFHECHYEFKGFFLPTQHTPRHPLRGPTHRQLNLPLVSSQGTMGTL